MYQIIMLILIQMKNYEIEIIIMNDQKSIIL